MGIASIIHSTGSGSLKGRRIRLVAAAAGMFFAGIIYAWSILKVPFSSEFGWSVSALALNYTLTLCSFCVGGMLGSRTSGKFSPRITVIIAACAVLAGFLITSKLNGNIIVLYLSYGLLSGTGIGMAYNAIISVCNAWFPDQKGTCTGILMMCFGISSLVLGNAADSLFHLQSIGWRKTYVILGILTFVFLITASLFMVFPDENLAFPASKKREKDVPKELFETEDFTTAQMIRRSSFWRFFMFMCLSSAVGSTIISFSRDFSISVGLQEKTAVLLVGGLSLCNGAGRIVSGYLLDRLGRRRTMILQSGFVILSAAVLLLATLTSLPLFCVAGMCLTGFGYGSTAPSVSLFTSTFYGEKNFAGNYSVANTMMIPSSFSASLAGVILASTGSYLVPVIILICFAVIGLLLNISLKTP